MKVARYLYAAIRRTLAGNISPWNKSANLKNAFAGRCKDTLSLDYVSGWFAKAADYVASAGADCAFVCTNSICQGIQVSSLWPVLLANGVSIAFAYTSFKWTNLASHNAGVTVSIVGLTKRSGATRRLFSAESDGAVVARAVGNINPYLVPGDNVFVVAAKQGTGRSHPNAVRKPSLLRE